MSSLLEGVNPQYSEGLADYGPALPPAGSARTDDDARRLRAAEKRATFLAEQADSGQRAVAPPASEGARPGRRMQSQHQTIRPLEPPQRLSQAPAGRIDWVGPQSMGEHAHELRSLCACTICNRSVSRYL